MAAPAEKTLKNLSGKWLINKAAGQSDSIEPILALQGIGWMTRKAINIATVTQHLKQYDAPAEDGSGATATHIDFDQVLTGGIKGTTEKRTLDNQWRSHTDHIFGDVRGRSRWVKIDEVLKESEGKEFLGEDVKFLVETWDDETKSGELVESYVENEDRGWTAWQLWGFAQIDGVRKHVRRVVVRKGKEVKTARLVYDWAGPLDN